MKGEIVSVGVWRDKSKRERMNMRGREKALKPTRIFWLSHIRAHTFFSLSSHPSVSFFVCIKAQMTACVTLQTSIICEESSSFLLVFVSHFCRLRHFFAVTFSGPNYASGVEGWERAKEKQEVDSRVSAVSERRLASMQRKRTLSRAHTHFFLMHVAQYSP